MGARTARSLSSWLPRWLLQEVQRVASHRHYARSHRLRRATAILATLSSTWCTQWFARLHPQPVQQVVSLVTTSQPKLFG